MIISPEPSARSLELLGGEIVAGLADVPFGAIPKSELDQLIFRALVSAGIVSLSSSNFELARQLQISVARVQAIKFAYRIRDSSVDDDTLLRDGVFFVPRASDTQTLVFSIEDRYTREVAIARLKTVNTFTDSSFNRERLVVATGDFEEFVGVLFPKDAKELKGAVARIRRKERLHTAAEAVSSLIASTASAFVVSLLTAAAKI
jgi:hypothetical protein